MTEPVYDKEPLRHLQLDQADIPCFSDTDDYTENYEKISADHPLFLPGKKLIKNQARMITTMIASAPITIGRLADPVCTGMGVGVFSYQISQTWSRTVPIANHRRQEVV